MSTWWPGPGDRPWKIDEPMPAGWTAGPAAWRARVAAWHRIQASLTGPPPKGMHARKAWSADRRSRGITTTAGTAKKAVASARSAGVQPPPKPTNFGPTAWYSQALGWQTPAANRRKVESQMNIDKAQRAAAEAKARRKERKSQDKAEKRKFGQWLEASRDAGRPIPLTTAPPPPELRASTVTVGNEPLVYGEGSDFSFLRDVYMRTTAQFSSLPPTASMRHGDHPRDVLDRLLRHEQQMRHLARTTETARRTYSAYFAEKTRVWQGTISDHAQENFRNFIFGETRDASTTTGSLGQFTPPLYLLEQFELFRTAASPAADRCAQRPLPPTGLRVTIPRFTSKVAVAKQTTQNTNVASATPTVAFVQADVDTLAGGVVASQQVFDRVGGVNGGGVTADRLLTAQAAREVGTQLDGLVLTAILAGTGLQTITNTGTPGTPALWADVGEASSKLQTLEGTRLQADTVLAPVQLASWFMAQLDKQTRPVFEPTPNNVAKAGAPTTPGEGATGFGIAGAALVGDASTALKSVTDGILIVGAFGTACAIYSSPAIVYVTPERLASQLSVTITFRKYVAVSLLYPSGFVKVTGAAYPWSPTFAGA